MVEAMRKILSINEFNKLNEELDKVKYTCKCGHRVIIPYHLDKNICSWCHRYVFKSKEAEFKFRMNERLRKEKWEKKY